MKRNSTNNSPLVSVIIPVYNASPFLQRALDSVYKQSLKDFEIIAVNDGSTDDSLRILKDNANQHKSLSIIDQQNHGQGFARNRALEKAKGQYILFLDADDWLEDDALEKLIDAAVANRADVAHCGWRASTHDKKTHRSSYRPSELFHSPELVGDNCDEFLRLRDYFSVNNLYRCDFLVHNNIRFSEGQIYEDNEFMAAVATRAQKIAFVDEPLYVVYFADNSSSRTGFQTDKHYKDLMKAIQKSFAVLTPRLPASKAYLAGYFLEKFVIYYQRRVPRKYRRSYLHDFVDSMRDKDIDATGAANVSKFLRLCVKLNVFEKRRYAVFGWCVFYKTRLLPLMENLRK